MEMPLLQSADIEPLTQFLTSLAIGLLIGLERERNPSAKAGLRTFALVAVFGTLAALLSTKLGSPWLLIAGLLAVASMIVAAYLKAPAEPLRQVGEGHRSRHHYRGCAAAVLRVGRDDLVRPRRTRRDAGNWHHRAALFQTRTARVVTEADPPRSRRRAAILRAHLHRVADPAQREFRPL